MPVLSNVVTLMRQHHILLWICAVVALNQLGFGIVVPVLPLFAEQFGVPQTAIGLAVAVYGLGRLLFNMPMGQLTERLGRRQVVFWGEIITAVGSLLCGLAPSFEWLLLFRFIGGIGAATVLTGAQVIITDISTRANRGRIMSVYMGWFLFAVGLGPTPGGLLAREFGLQAPFFAFAIMSLLAALLCWWKLPETRHLAERRPIIVPGTLLSGLAFAAFAGVTSYPHFLLICLLWGLAGGIGGTAPGAYAADLAPPGANGVTMGIYRTLSDAGYVVGPALLGLIADSFGAEPALLTMGSVFIVAGLLFGLFAPETHRRVAAKAAAD
jgi:MFS transporter, DHA1 family, multidrug resistance protein